jgi:hypothetical protein
MKAAKKIDFELPDANQLHLLHSLGVDAPETATASKVADLIENYLGGEASLEQVRWYLLSVLRHINQANWQDPEDCKLSDEVQRQLSARLLAVPGARKSLEQVLRNKNARYRLLTFADRSNAATLTMSRGTRLFQHASKLINDAQGIKDSASQEKDKDIPLTGINARRAQRRMATIPESVPPAASESPESKPEACMTLEDYEKFERAILTPVDARLMRRATYKTAEDRLSLLAGVVSAVLIFLLVLWVFY